LTDGYVVHSYGADGQDDSAGDPRGEEHGDDVIVWMPAASSE
jgi:hypothetical protein